MKMNELARDVVALLKNKSITVATAESCTGGGIGYCLTSVSGSSDVYLGGVVSYANEVKENVLHVPAVTLQNYGAVSAETASAMACGIKKLLRSDIAVSVTGIAGPGSDGTEKPVGLVYIALSYGDEMIIKENHFSGTRDQVREESIQTALEMIIEYIK